MQLKSAADELGSLAKTDRVMVPPPVLFQRLGEALEDIGENERADEMYLWADRVSAEGRGTSARHRSRRPGPPDEADSPPPPPEPPVNR